MKRQVDLYQEQFKESKQILSALTILQLAAVLLAGLVLFYGLPHWSASIQTSKLASLRDRLATESQRIAELSETHPPATADPALETQLQRLNAERDAKTQLIRALSTESLGNVAGFSQHVAGLARQRVPGLWLREIRIQRGGRELSLAGSTLEPDLVPHFIQQLGLETAFSGSEFRSLRMQRSESDDQRIDFSLRTEAEEQP